jgi:hypothetical protein
MIQTHDTRTENPVVASVPDRLGVLAHDFHTRIVNCSPTGCLLETSSPIEVGTIGHLRFLIDGREVGDDVQVVRCQSIEGAGPLFQVGVRFLWTMVPGKDSLRSALSQSSVERLRDSRVTRRTT